jgi:two-component system nitrogen regulation response regulator NtrX
LKRPRVLIMEDLFEENASRVTALEKQYDMCSVATMSEAVRQAVDGECGVMMVSRADWVEGEQVAEITRARVPTIVFVEDGCKVEDISRLLDTGADDCIEATASIERVVCGVERAFRHGELRDENRRLRKRVRESEQARSLVGSSQAMQHIRKKVRLVAETNEPVIVMGESGTGKEVVAREVHRLSDRSEEPLVLINCAAIPGPLLDRELFGVKEAAEGPALRTTRGRFEMADGGTIVLDEIGDMSPGAQAKLVRVIQDGHITHQGGSEPVPVDVRLIATTSRPLDAEIRKGKFRKDLYYRLNVVPIVIPPLNDRREDIPFLIEHFIEVFSRRNKKAPVRLTDGALRALRQANWRGNVRELENMVERMVILSPGASVDEDCVQLDGGRDRQLVRMEKTFRSGSIREMEELMIMHRLGENEQNRTHSARTLQISVRTLRNKLREYRERDEEPAEARK